MNLHDFWIAAEGELQTYDLLAHPFYRAWTAGELTRAEIGFYGRQYRHHVAAFPAYLTALHCRLEEGETRRAVLLNAAEEEIHGISHADLWRQFVAGLDPAKAAQNDELLPEVRELIETYRDLARRAAPAAALGAFYAYESQVPRIAEEKLAGLKRFYDADERTSEYFTLHRTADVGHARVWRRLIERTIGENGAHADEALDGVRQGAKALWGALDGIESARHSLLHI